jgi:hypothetical protein
MVYLKHFKIFLALLIIAKNIFRQAMDLFREETLNNI